MLSKSKLRADIPAKDIKRARDFYENKLGFKVLDDSMETSIIFQADDGSMFHVYQTDNAGGDATRLTFVVDDHADSMAQMRDAGIKFEDYEGDMATKDGVMEMEGLKGAWFKDPDGNILCLFQVAKVPAAA